MKSGVPKNDNSLERNDTVLGPRTLERHDSVELRLQWNAKVKHKTTKKNPQLYLNAPVAGEPEKNIGARDI